MQQEIPVDHGRNWLDTKFPKTEAIEVNSGDCRFRTAIQPGSPTSRIIAQRVDVSMDDVLFRKQKIKVISDKEYFEQGIQNDENTMVLDFNTHVLDSEFMNHQIHLSFPSTLLRRPNFKFERLVGTLNESTQKKLMNGLYRCKNILMIDDGSFFWTSCLYSTVAVLRKVADYLVNSKGSNETTIYLLQNGIAALQCYMSPAASSRSLVLNKPIFYSFPVSDNSTPANKSKMNPKHFNPDSDLVSQPNALSKTINQKSASENINTSSELFIQTIKCDTLRYSTELLDKYFSYRTPRKMPHSVPRWFRQFNRTGENILLDILSKFELLEQLEIQRLRKCLSCNSSNDSFSRATYSIKNLQKQYSVSRSKATEDKCGIATPSNFKYLDDCPSLLDSNTYKLTMNSGELNDIKDNDRKNKLKLRIDTQLNYLNQDKYHDEELVETPSDFYVISQGINSFFKNRYSNIIPYEHTRVKLERSPLWHEPSPKIPLQPLNHSSTTEDSGLDKTTKDFKHILPSSCFSTKFENNGTISFFSPSKEPFNDYFNASYLSLPEINPKCKYIATQAPLLSTIDDFWKVVTANNVKVIVSLNSNDELNLKKWDIYWKSDNLKKYEIKVINVFENAYGMNGVVVREFQVRKKPVCHNTDSDDVSATRYKTYSVFQIQYTQWLDSCGIDISDFLQLYNIKNALISHPKTFMEKLQGQEFPLNEHLFVHNTESIRADSSIDPTSPLLVHCSAGCGRTGVFITLDFLLTVLQKPYQELNKIDVWNIKEDLIFIVVNEFRKQRISMVQNFKQYITCYEILLEYFSLREEFESIK